LKHIAEKDETIILSSMPIISTDKLSSLRSVFQKARVSQPIKKYCIQTFGCQMNYADSEKIHMLLAQAGLARVEEWSNADVVIFNTCSVRQKSEDKVFGYIEEIKKIREKTGRNIIVGMTGCMTRKTGLNKKYYDYQGRKNTTKITRIVSENQRTREPENQIITRSRNQVI